MKIHNWAVALTTIALTLSTALNVHAAKNCIVSINGQTDKTILTNACKITGAGVYAGGARVALRATAAKGFVFAGWSLQNNNAERSFSDYGDARNPALSIPKLTNDLTLAARFIPTQEDYCGEISVSFNENGIPEGPIDIDSLSLPTVTVTGLPKGLTYDRKSCQLVYQASKMPEGDYSFIVAAKNASGYRNEQIIEFTTGDYTAEDDAPDAWLGDSFTVGTSTFVDSGFLSDTAKDSLAISHLPPGLKLVKYYDDDLPYYMIEGTPTKTGRYTVTWKETHYIEADESGRLVVDEDATYSAQYYFYVNCAPSQFIGANADALPGGCKVTGSGIYAAGSKIALKATASKGYVFAGWYEDEDRLLPVENCTDYRAPTLSLTELPDAMTIYYPKFVELKDDFCGAITLTDDEDDVPQGLIEVASVSLPTVTVTGLPKGLTYDKKSCALVCDANKMTDGDYAFVISAKNAGGYQNSRVFTFAYGSDYDDIELRYEYAQGEIVTEPLDFNAWTSRDKMSVSGLPPGLKLVATRYLSDDETPVNLMSYAIEGIPTKVGRYTVKATTTIDGETETETFYIIVDGAPSRYIEVVTDGTAGCSASGSGVYAPGNTVKSSVKMPKNVVFAGWYADTNAFGNAYAEFLEKDGDYRIAAQTWLCGDYTADGEKFDALPDKLIGHFAPTSEDTLTGESIRIVDESDLETDIGSTWDDSITGIWVYVASLSAPKLTAKGIPAGLTVKNYGTQMHVFYDATGKTAPKPGNYIVTLTAQNQSKSSTSRKLTINIPQY